MIGEIGRIVLEDMGLSNELENVVMVNTERVEGGLHPAVLYNDPCSAYRFAADPADSSDDEKPTST